MPSSLFAPSPTPLPPAAWASSQCLQWYQVGGHGHSVLNLLLWAVPWWVRCDRERRGRRDPVCSPVGTCVAVYPEFPTEPAESSWSGVS